VQESGNMLGVSAEDRSTQVSRLEKAKEADKNLQKVLKELGVFSKAILVLLRYLG